MIWIFLFQLIAAMSAWSLLHIQAVRNYLVGAGALALRITVGAAETLFRYLLACLVGVIFLNLGFFIGLLARAIGLPNFGNFIITASFISTALVLGILTLALAALTAAVASAIVRARQAVANATTTTGNQTFAQLIEELKKQFPDQKDLLAKVETATGGWLASIFDFTGIRAILAIPHTVVFDTIEAATKGVGQMFSWVLAVLLWLFIAGFAAIWFPESTAVFWIIAIAYSVLVMASIATYKGEAWCQKYNLWDPWWLAYKWSRRGFKLAIVAIVVTAIWVTVEPWGQRHFSHWIVGTLNYFNINEEQSAKDKYGQRYDQNIGRVVESGVGYRIEQAGWFSGTRQIPVDIRVNEFLWNTGLEHSLFPDGRYYAQYHRALQNRIAPNADDVVWFPESQIAAAGSLETEQKKLAANTAYYPDNYGVPYTRVAYLTIAYEAEVTNLTAYADGQKVRFARVHDRGRIYDIWLKI